MLHETEMLTTESSPPSNFYCLQAQAEFRCHWQRDERVSFPDANTHSSSTVTRNILSLAIPTSLTIPKQ